MSVTLTTPRKRILLITFPAYGHIIPILELGRRISNHHDVTVAVSAVTVDAIKRKELLHPTVDKITFCPINDGLREDNCLHPASFPDFVQKMNIVLEGIRAMVAALPAGGSRPDAFDVIITEQFVAAATVECVQKNIQLYHFSPNALGAQLFYLQYDHSSWPTVPDEGIIPLSELPKPGAPLSAMPETMKKWSQQINATYRYSRGIVLNSVKEMEEDAYRQLVEYFDQFNAKVYAVGPLLTPTESDYAEKRGTSEKEEQVLNWLNGKQDKSVVYVSFGTMAGPNAEEIRLLGEAFLTLNQNTLWSLPEFDQQYLPEQLRRSPSACFLVVNWAPQKSILNHSSVGLFVSHCGWNSTLESLTSGVPVVAWPMFADQLINGQFLESKGTAVVVQGTGLLPKRVVPVEEIVELCREVGGWTGREVRRTSFRTKAQEWSGMLRGVRESAGCSTRMFEELIGDLGK